MASAGFALSDSLKCRVETRNGATVVSFAGHINEAADFTKLKNLSGPLVFDLSEIDRINSLGVRDWIRLVREINTAGIELTFERCSPMIISQYGMISNFMGPSPRIKSVLVPYLCPACQHEHLQTQDVTPGVALSVPLKLPCPKCQTPMDLDDLAETYNRVF